MSKIRDLTLREARHRFFQRHRIPADGGYDDSFVVLRFLGFPIPLPNVPSRKRFVPYHDVHHILAGYGTTWVGEAEVAAWEFGSGLAVHWEPWLVNLHAVAIGLVKEPRTVFRAFVRGRCQKNAYDEALDEALLSETVGSLRRRLNIDDRTHAPHWADYSAFARLLAILLPTVSLTLALALLPVCLIAVVMFR
jgi:hypothetical protein